MSVEQSGVIDYASLDNESDCVLLTISDHLDWTDDKNHVWLLQEKINRYLGFIESGEVLETLDYAKGRDICIDVVFKYEPNELGLQFLSSSAEAISEAGFKLTHKTLKQGKSE